MEVFNKLKELSKERFEDNFYLGLGLIFLITYQLIRDLLNIFVRFSKFLVDEIIKRFKK